MRTLTIPIAANADDGEADYVSFFQNSDFANSVGRDGIGPLGNWYRFASVNVRPKAPILYAFFTFEKVTGGAGSTVLSRIFGVLEANHAAPTTWAEFNTDHGIHTAAFVDYNFSIGLGVAQTPNLAPIIQELVNQGSWAYGNAIGIHWDDNGSAANNTQFIGALEHSTATPVSLTIVWADGGGGGYAAIAEVPISDLPVVTTDQTLSGVLFTVLPTFPVGAVIADQTLSGVLFSRAPSFPAGALIQDQFLNGVLFSRAPTFPAGTLSALNTLSGVLFSRAPDFPVGTVLALNTLSGVLFSRAPSFPAGSLSQLYELNGVLFSVTPIFGVGTLTGGAPPVLGIIARAIGQFQRKTSSRLHLAKIGTAGRVGYSTADEGWERVSDVFIYDEHTAGGGNQTATMVVVAGAWAIHAAGSAAALQAAIHTALDAAGYLRPDGTRLV